MEEVHGVDVSWLHHPNKALHSRTSSKSLHHPPKGTDSQNENVQPSKLANGLSVKTNRPPSPPSVTPPTPVHQAKERMPQTPNATAPLSKTPPKRPSLLKNASDEGKSGSRRSSWMNSISSKFSSSSSSTPERNQMPVPPSQNAAHLSTSPPAANGTTTTTTEQNAQSHVPSKPKDSSFFSSITRRLSSASQTSTPTKSSRGGTVCARRVLNLDPNRERCRLPELESSRLRRVSFCVDVEIAGGPRYYDDDDDDAAGGSDVDRERKKKEFKLRERAEGEALKRPELLKEEADQEGAPKLEQKATAMAIPKTAAKDAPAGNDPDGNSPPAESLDEAAAQRKKDKKKRSEEERKERKEKRRRRAEENGQVPLEMSFDDAEGDSEGSTSMQEPRQNGVDGKSFVPMPGSIPLPPLMPSKQQADHAKSSRQIRPTMNPVRIYRRCCQLRESPILKRITEQLSSPTCCLPSEPGVVTCLDLTGSRLQLADVATLGDWLAVVPVKKLIYEDGDLSDEGVRCVLAGLLAAKKPEPTRRKSSGPRHREGVAMNPYQERSGVVERVSFKNNPRITRHGWKHIALFLYSCRSLKAMDLSMNRFPLHFSPPGPKQEKSEDIDAAETMYKCLSERRGGSRLEELILSECNLNSSQIRRLIDGVMACGTARLGLAGNHLDDEGLAHVMRYLRSDICRGLDIGGNDLRGKLGIVAEALQGENSKQLVWGLSLAGCNLDSASLKPLFPALQQLPNFRFIDLSHNRDLFKDNETVSLLRRYIGQLHYLKRIHLSDCNISPKQAIALADALPDGPQLAHLNLLNNPQLTALAEAKTEEQQEEACALYASLMAAVRVSSTLICIDIDVPSQGNSEVVKALAKQVIAYSLRNVEQFAIAEATGASISTANATNALTSAYGGEKQVRELRVPDVLMHLVGHMDGVSENHDNDDPAPDDDYIVGGTGVVKALQYVLGEKANDRDLHSPTASGVTTPSRPSSVAGTAEYQRCKAKKMSTDLLDSARKIRARLQPALVKEAASGDDISYRRLLFLEQTLQSMISRFEEEYPETRKTPVAAAAAAAGDQAITGDETADGAASAVGVGTHAVASGEDRVGRGNESDEEDEHMIHSRRNSRQSSEINLASRSQTIEEGRLHRLGTKIRREVIDSPRTPVAEGSSLPPWHRDHKADNTVGTVDPASPDQIDTEAPDEDAAAAAAAAADRERLLDVGKRIEALSGPELRSIYDMGGFDKMLTSLGGTYEDLRRLQEEDPEGWELFKEAQAKARLNVAQDASDAPRVAGAATD